MPKLFIYSMANKLQKRLNRKTERKQQKSYLAPGRGPTPLAQSSPLDSSLVFYLPAPLRCSVEVHRRHRRRHRDASRLPDLPPPPKRATEHSHVPPHHSSSSGRLPLLLSRHFRASPRA